MTKSNKLTISGRAVSCYFEYEKSADYIIRGFGHNH